MPNTKPFVAVACLCENAIQEKDGVFTLVRIIDTFFIPPQPIPPDRKPAIEVTAFVSLKSGDVKGKSEISVKFRNPADKTPKNNPTPWPILLQGGEHGVNLLLRFVLPIGTYGLYWCDVFWNGELLTSIPFKLVQGEPPISAAGTPDSPSPAPAE